jgi:hypothetical protein
MPRPKIITTITQPDGTTLVLYRVQQVLQSGRAVLASAAYLPPGQQL